MKMNHFAYPATLVPDAQDGGFVVTFIDLPEAITQGDDLADALHQAADCLEEAIAGRISDKEIIPKPSPVTQENYLVHLPAQTAVKASLYRAMCQTAMTQSELAKTSQ
jgi:antitoxin HicB